MKTNIRLLLLIITIFYINCSSPKPEPFDIKNIKTYLEIPGVTQAEIDAIEALKKTRRNFSYGQMYETEAFILPDGTNAGFAIEFCKLLSGLFGIDFVFEFREWESILEGLNSFELDFSGELIPTEERLKYYYMTHLIAERTQRIFMLAENYDNFITERDLHGLNVGVLPGSADAEQINKYYPELTLNFVEASDFDAAAEMLKAGIIDVFAIEGVFDPAFEKYGFISSKEFFPLAYSPVSMTTANPALSPVITVMNKYIAQGGIDILFDLYRKGEDEYTRYKLAKLFTQEEKEYIDSFKAGGRTVKVALETGNYPVCFFDNKTGKFEGIAPDVLAEITSLTGIVFETANDEKTEWTQILEMLKSGEVSLVSELIPSAEREGLFLWVDKPYASWSYALISRYDYPNLVNYQVVRTKVGTMEGSAFADKYNEWFPDNDNLTLYKTSREVFNALEKGEIDLMIGSDHMLLMQQNYYQNPGFKININYHTPTHSYFGLNIDEEILCSVICKTISFVKTGDIESRWTSRGYDYATQMANQRAFFYFIITVIMALMFILTLFILLLNKRRQRTEKELDKRKAAEEKAKAESEAKSRFLANMSHEIRSPMNVILGSAESLLESLGKENVVNITETKEILEKIHDSGDLLLRIINDILDLSKIEANKFEIINAKYDTASLINDAVNLNIMKYNQKEIKLKLHVDENLPVFLIGDELRIKQIINNLLSNAFKYTDSGEISLSFIREKKVSAIKTADTIPIDDIKTSSISQEGGGIMFVIRVTDTGQGLTPEQLAQLFGEYTRFNTDANRTTAGTGLGMAITNNLVKLMNGKITVQSAPERGSEFTVYIPQGTDDNRVLGRENAENLANFRFSGSLRKEKEMIEKTPMPYGKVLIVDDMKYNIDVAILLLKPYQLQIDTALSGFEAVNIIKSGKVYDIIFMDHMMPKMDGIETVKKIRETGYTHSIVALTANAIVGQAEVFMDNGFDGCITKPIDMRELNAILNEYIRKKHISSA